MKDFLPDIFNKDKNSNISKLIKIANDEIDNLFTLSEEVELWRSIDDAKGTTLDFLGENVGQLRGKATDEVFRVLIRGKNARNYCDGSLDKIVTALSVSLQCEASEIYIVNGHENGEMASIAIEKVPIHYLNTSGLSMSQFSQLVKSIIPAGVSITFVNLEGTFSFSKNLSEVEWSNDGFADMEGTVGGTLGAVYKPDNDYKLVL